MPQSGHILEIWNKIQYWPERALFYQKKATILKKGPQNLPLPLHPYSIPVLTVLHQNKALHNFCKMGSI